MSRWVANLLLLLTALIWGTTFVAQQLSASHLGALAYTGARFLLGALCIAPLAWLEWRRARAAGVSVGRGDVLGWVGLGVLLFLGAYLQQVGIAITTVSNAGFLTALYVPLVPFVLWVMERKRPPAVVWPCTAASFVGAFMLSGGQFSALSAGDLWVISSTVFWALHVAWVGRLAARKGLPVLLACVQFIACGLLAVVMAGVQENTTSVGLVAAVPAILYGGVLSVGVAFTLQVITQRYTHAVDAALLLSSEILFAALAGVLYLGERLAPIQWAGGAVIFVAIVSYQLLAMQAEKAAAALDGLEKVH